MRRPASFFRPLFFERRPRPFRGDAERRRGTATEQISAGHETSIYHHRGASYPLRVVAGEIERHSSYVFAGAGTRNRLNRPEQLLDDRFATRDMLVDERRVDAAWTNAVDADAVAAEIDRGALGQVNDSGLGNAVRQRTRATSQSCNRRGGDNRPATRLRRFVNRALDAAEDAARQ